MTRSGGSPPDLRLLGLEDARPLGHDGTYVLEVAAGPEPDVEDTLDTVRRLPGVVWARETAPRSACLIPDDPFYPPGSGMGQWSLPRIRLPEAWDLETGSAEVIVAILDTGIDQYRADFAGRIVSPYNAIERDTAWPSWRDNMGHGTAVAGVAVAQGNDDQGMAGTAWNVKIMPVKIADDQSGSDDSILAEGLYWAVDHGADVINISFAGVEVTTTEADAVRYAVERGVIVVAAAGNDSTDLRVLSGRPAWGHRCGGHSSDVERFAGRLLGRRGRTSIWSAPGTEIFSHNVGSSSWGSWAGTSFSAPLVAGVAALVRSAEPGLDRPAGRRHSHRFRRRISGLPVGTGTSAGGWWMLTRLSRRPVRSPRAPRPRRLPRPPRPHPRRRPPPRRPSRPPRPRPRLLPAPPTSRMSLPRALPTSSR